jgi:protein FRA10AC1
MRWRTIEEVKLGKGDKICANVDCERIEGLTSLEVVFGYQEDEKRKNVLVKCILCEKCARKMRKARGEDRTSKERSKHRSTSRDDEQDRKRRRHSRHREDETSEERNGKRSRPTAADYMDEETKVSKRDGRKDDKLRHHHGSHHRRRIKSPQNA